MEPLTGPLHWLCQQLYNLFAIVDMYGLAHKFLRLINNETLELH
jgi:hypothetical protein